MSDVADPAEMIEEPTDTKVPSYFASLLKSITIEEEEFEVALPTGHVLKFAHLEDGKHYQQVKDAANTFASVDAPGPGLVPFWETTFRCKVWSYIMGALCTTDKGTENAPGAAGFLAMQQLNPLLFENFLDDFQNKLWNKEKILEERKILQAKKE